jgi:hypothetical protein
MKMLQMKRRRFALWTGVLAEARGILCAPWLFAETRYPSRPAEPAQKPTIELE